MLEDDAKTPSSRDRVEARVLEELPSKKYRLELTGSKRVQVVGHPAGAVKTNFLRLRVNDRVLVELAPHDKTRGRIVEKL